MFAMPDLSALPHRLTMPGLSALPHRFAMPDLSALPHRLTMPGRRTPSAFHVGSGRRPGWAPS